MHHAEVDGRATVVLSAFSRDEADRNVAALSSSVDKMEFVVLSPSPLRGGERWRSIGSCPPGSLSSFNLLAKSIATPFAIVILSRVAPTITAKSLHRFVDAAQTSNAALLYADFEETVQGVKQSRPVLAYQVGSFRHDFDFGPVVCINMDHLRKALRGLDEESGVGGAGWYAVRLALSRGGDVVRIPEMLSSVSGELGHNQEFEHFSYVDPANASSQRVLESVFTSHLEEIGAFLPPPTATVDLSAGYFDVEASIVIPVLNRESTIRDALESALSQKAEFPYNVIVVDNHSTDGTTAIVARIASRDKRVQHIIPEQQDLGIGGCWSRAVYDARCGRFCVQLDSDDLYADERTVSAMVAALRKERCAMVVGSYKLTDRYLREIPPGVIDHREWTEENGHNNLLRVNGIGAPRAYHTPTLRTVGFPNVSYGEDYAVALAISRRWRIGRIFTPVYLCRRWEGNSDARPSVETLNRFNSYKDALRSAEVEVRRAMNGHPE